MLPARWLLGVTLVSLSLGAAAASASAPGVEARVARVEALLARARFREAAEQAPSLRHDVISMPPSAAARRLLVRTEVAAGTAALALRQETAARTCFLRALQIEPTLALGGATPPKVQRAFEAAREGR